MIDLPSLYPQVNNLVLSLFPGLDLFGYAFKQAGFSVVRGGDYIFGEDIRTEHYPAGRFDGVIGGPPCQAFSRLSHMVRHNGFEPKFGNLIPEFERVVSETACQWFVMEEVPDAPEPVVSGYGVHSFLLNNRQLGEDQNRVRRISFGWRGERRVLMLETVALESKRFQYAATGAGRGIPIAVGGSGKPKRTLRSGRKVDERDALNQATRRSAEGFAAVKALQGYPPEFDIPAFKVEAKVQAVANSVPLPMRLAIARAVKEAQCP